MGTKPSIDYSFSDATVIEAAPFNENFNKVMGFVHPDTSTYILGCEIMHVSSYLSAANIIVNEFTVTALSATGAIITSANIDTLSVDDASISALSATDVIINSANVEDLDVSALAATDAIINSADVGDVTVSGVVSANSLVGNGIYEGSVELIKEGSFTGYSDSFDAQKTGLCKYAIIKGNWVILNMCGKFYGTSTSVTWSIYGLPAEIQPTNEITCGIPTWRLYNSGSLLTNESIAAVIGYSGEGSRIVFALDHDSNGWANTANKGFAGYSNMVYSLVYNLEETV